MFYFFQYVDYEIRHPLRTTIGVSNSTDGDISGESFYSIKYVLSLEKELLDYVKSEEVGLCQLHVLN